MKKPTSQDVDSLYYLMGKALCMIQYLEDALSHSITLKKDMRCPGKIGKEEADRLLAKQRSFTLGKGIAIAKEKGLYSDILQDNLEKFLLERNWLVHKCVPLNIDDMYVASSKEILFHRIEAISLTARMLQREIEADLMKFSESVGVDMSEVQAEIERYYKML